MAKPKAYPVVHPNAWNKTHGTYLTGCSHIDGVDVMAAQLEELWGCGRLRLLVDQPLREKFDRQRYLYNAAITNGELEDVRRESERMIRAWRAVAAAAIAAGAKPIDPVTMEVALEDGTVLIICPTNAEARVTLDQVAGRKAVVYTLEELARIVGHYRDVVNMKLSYPGSEVTRVAKDVSDPLDGIRYATDLNDPLDDLFHEGAFQ